MFRDNVDLERTRQSIASTLRLRACPRFGITRLVLATSDNKSCFSVGCSVACVWRGSAKGFVANSVFVWESFFICAKIDHRILWFDVAMVFPFFTCPDVFELTIPTNLENMRLEYFEAAWGVTDELLCYFNGFLIGQVFSDDSPGYLGLGYFKSHGTKAIQIRLLPRLNKQRNYSWANHQEFANALIQLLSMPIPWVLHCEYDCDTRPVQQIENNLSMTILELEKTLEYCAGESFDCPSFISIQRIV
jgi:hypothetical protein